MGEEISQRMPSHEGPEIRIRKAGEIIIEVARGGK